VFASDYEFSEKKFRMIREIKIQVSEGETGTPMALVLRTQRRGTREKSAKNGVF
jgi:hypothetical protein